MIQETRYWMCTLCGHIQYSPMQDCPACSTKEVYTYTNNNTNKLEEK